jgi:hypothetical protein
MLTVKATRAMHIPSWHTGSNACSPSTLHMLPAQHLTIVTLNVWGLWLVSRDREKRMQALAAALADNAMKAVGHDPTVRALAVMGSS